MGVLIRHFFNTVHAGGRKPWWTWGATAVVFVAIMALGAAPLWQDNAADAQATAQEQAQAQARFAQAASFPQAADVVRGNCAMCQRARARLRRDPLGAEGRAPGDRRRHRRPCPPDLPPGGGEPRDAAAGHRHDDASRPRPAARLVAFRDGRRRAGRRGRRARAATGRLTLAPGAGAALRPRHGRACPDRHRPRWTAARRRRVWSLIVTIMGDLTRDDGAALSGNAAPRGAGMARRHAGGGAHRAPPPARGSVDRHGTDGPGRGASPVARGLGRDAGGRGADLRAGRRAVPALVLRHDARPGRPAPSPWRPRCTCVAVPWATIRGSPVPRRGSRPRRPKRSGPRPCARNARRSPPRWPARRCPWPLDPRRRSALRALIVHDWRRIVLRAPDPARRLRACGLGRRRDPGGGAGGARPPARGLNGRGRNRPRWGRAPDRTDTTARSPSRPSSSSIAWVGGHLDPRRPSPGTGQVEHTPARARPGRVEPGLQRGLQDRQARRDPRLHGRPVERHAQRHRLRILRHRARRLRQPAGLRGGEPLEPDAVVVQPCDPSARARRPSSSPPARRRRRGRPSPRRSSAQRGRRISRASRGPRRGRSPARRPARGRWRPARHGGSSGPSISPRNMIVAARLLP